MADKLVLDSKSYIVSLRKSGSNFSMKIGNLNLEGNFSRTLDGRVDLQVGDNRSICYSEKNGDEVYVFINGVNYFLKRLPHRNFDQESEDDNSDIVLSPITGKLLDKTVQDGDEVSKGDVVIILEAMKMEHRLKSPRDGKLLKVTNSEIGGQVREGDLMFELEAE